MEPIDFLNQEYPVHVRSQFIPILETGASLVNALFDEHPEFYTSSISPNIRGRLFTFAVMLQFAPDVGIFSASGYRLQYKQVNKFKYQIPELVTASSVLHVAKVSARQALPLPSNYKRLNAISNYPFASQREMDINLESMRINNIIDSRKYVLLTYGSRDNRKIDFARLLLPDHRFEAPIHDGIINLNDEFKSYAGGTAPIAFEEKQMLKLKEEFKKRWEGILKSN